MVHTEPRYTKDLDLWIDRSTANAQAVFQPLAQFGALTGYAIVYELSTFM